MAVLARNPEKNAAVLAELKDMGVPALALALDVIKRDTLPGIMADVEASLGGIDILVNNAGTVDVSGGMLHQSESGWDNAIATHLDATFLLSTLAAQSMMTRKGGKIINLASMTSIFGASALPSYSATKSAIVQLTKSMAIEFAVHNTQVNAIAPGWIAAEMTAIARSDPAWEGFNAMLMARTPAARWGEADECAGAAVFPASPAANFITGVMLPINGGYSVF